MSSSSSSSMLWRDIRWSFLARKSGRWWFYFCLYIAGLENDPVQLKALLSGWKKMFSVLLKKPQNHELISTGLDLTSQMCRSVWKTIDLFFVPKLFIRYLYATATLHIGYEIFSSLKKKIVYLFLNLTSSTGRKINALRSQLECAKTYQEREAIAMELDKVEKKDEWRNEPVSTLYQYQRVVEKTAMYRHLQLDQDYTGLMFYLRAGLLRKHWGLGNPKLYNYSHVGTKRSIEEYMNTIVESMEVILDAKPMSADGIDHEELSTNNKLEFFSETRHAFGRSALLLSGGGSLGLYHSGVIRALAQTKMLPTVVAGSSAGSIVAGVVGVRTDEEILQSFEDADLKLQFFGFGINKLELESRTWNVLSKLKKALKSPVLLESMHASWYLVQRWIENHYLMDINVLKDTLRENMGDYTFREAYDRTGRIINITVTSSHSADYPQLLNYLTAPNVLIWSASLASCAIPGIYSPVELLAKDKHGNITQYYPEGLKWSDGSFECDLPMERLSELFNVNLFIVSQVNIHYKAISGYDSFGAGKVNALLGFMKKQMKTFLKNAVELSFNTKFLRLLRIGWIPLLTQSYEGDITICANENLSLWKMCMTILKNPTSKEYEDIILMGERAAWKYIPRIRTMCQIEFALERAVRRLRAEQAEEDAKQGKMTRVPSFYSSSSTNNLAAMMSSKTKSSSSDHQFGSVVVGTGLRRNKSMHVAGAVMTTQPPRTN